MREKTRGNFKLRGQQFLQPRALRVLGSGHTYPVFVTVGGKPIRASRRSAEWLRKSADALWDEKHRLMRESERSTAAEAYDHARQTYDRIIAESDVA